MAKAVCPALKAPRFAGARSLHPEAGPRCFGRKRGALFGDDCARLLRTAEPGRNFSPRWLGKTVAFGSKHGGVHGFARCASSRPGMHAGPSAWIPAADEVHLRDLGLEETMEGVWIHPSAIAGVRESQPPAHEGWHFWRGWFHRGCAPRARRSRGPARFHRKDDRGLRPHDKTA